MDFELTGRTVFGWGIALLLGFVAGAVVFYTPQTVRQSPLRTSEAPAALPAAPAPVSSLSATAPAAVNGERAAAPSAESYLTTDSRNATAAGTAFPDSARIVPAYGAAAAGVSGTAGTPASLASPPGTTQAVIENEGNRAGAVMNSAAASQVLPQRPAPIIDVAGHSLQGDSVLSAPPSNDPRRAYRMSIDVSTIP